MPWTSIPKIKPAWRGRKDCSTRRVLMIGIRSDKTRLDRLPNLAERILRRAKYATVWPASKPGEGVTGSRRSRTAPAVSFRLHRKETTAKTGATICFLSRFQRLSGAKGRETA
jgi:hypothetical protein